MKQFLVHGMILATWITCLAHADILLIPEQSTGTAVGETLAAEPFQWPVSAFIGKRKIKIVSGFGRRAIPGGQSHEMHEGVDFAVPPESNVKAARSGKVLFAGFSTAYVSRKDKKEKHHLVIIRHADGMSSRYVHLNRLRVRPGQEVLGGDVIGTSSDSDEWPQAVLHFEIRSAAGTALDPKPLLEQAIVAPGAVLQ